MDPNNPTNDDPFSAALPIPDADQPAVSKNPAADIVRQKVQAAYSNEPDAATEALDIAQVGSVSTQSRHQKFIYELTSSGKSLPEIQAAWHEYYAGLTDVDKHQVWQEFYSVHAQASRFPAAKPAIAPTPVVTNDQPIVIKHPKANQKPISRTLSELRDYALGAVSTDTKLKPMQHFQSLLFGLGVGSVVILIFLFSFFNERFIAPFIQPSRNTTNTPIINDSSTIGPDPEIIIPKINVEIPVVYDVASIDEASVDAGLERGVVHYADTALPGQDGNIAVVGHSSNNIFNHGKYKFAFVLLSRLENGDTFYLQKDGKRYTYQVYKKTIVKPNNVSVLGPTEKPATATLITCDPPGTSTNRLVVVGEQISPDISTNTDSNTANKIATESTIIPGNAPSLWSRLWGWFSH